MSIVDVHSKVNVSIVDFHSSQNKILIEDVQNKESKCINCGCLYLFITNANTDVKIPTSLHNKFKLR